MAFRLLIDSISILLTDYKKTLKVYYMAISISNVNFSLSRNLICKSKICKFM